MQLATLIDFQGKLGLRLGKAQIQPYIAIYGRDRAKLSSIVESEGDFSGPIFVSKGLYMVQIISVTGVKRVLERTVDYLSFEKEIAQKCLSLCESRLNHPTTPYTLGELKLAQEIVAGTSRPASVEQRLLVLEAWK